MALVGLFTVTVIAMILVAAKAGATRALTFLMWAVAAAYGFTGGL